IREKNLFQKLKQAAREIGPKTLGAFAFMGVLVVVIGITFILAQQRQTTSQQAAGTSPCQFQTSEPGTNIAFCETFDAPAGTGNRSGQLNGTLWGASRATGNVNLDQGAFNGWAPTQLVGCTGTS